MNKTAEGLVAYAKAQLGKPYWWGTFGQISTEALYAQKKNQYPNEYLSNDFLSQLGQRVHDCVGLIKAYRWSESPNAAPKYVAAQDVSVVGLYSQCTLRGAISTMPDIPGVCVFMGSFGHVGVYIGNGEVIEARGHSFGVVKTKLSSRGWSFWGMPEWLEYTETPAAPETSTNPPQTQAYAMFTPAPLRILKKGMTGNDVRRWQQLLIAAGFPVGPAGADGEFGSATYAATVSFQKSVREEPDGEVGQKTFTAMWRN